MYLLYYVAVIRNCDKLTIVANFYLTSIFNDLKIWYLYNGFKISMVVKRL